MQPTACGIGGSFTTEASFCLDNFKALLSGLHLKVFTGSVILPP